MSNLSEKESIIVPAFLVLTDVFDMSGRAVMKERIASAPGSIEVRDLAPGAYVAVVTVNGQSFSAKFMRN